MAVGEEGEISGLDTWRVEADYARAHKPPAAVRHRSLAGSCAPGPTPLLLVRSYNDNGACSK